MSERTLLRNGCVLTLDPALGNHRQADVLIEGSKIKAVAPSIPVGDAYVIEPGHDARVVGDEAVVAFEFEQHAAETFARG